MKVHIPRNEDEFDDEELEALLASDEVGACSLDDPGACAAQKVEQAKKAEKAQADKAQAVEDAKKTEDAAATADAQDARGTQSQKAQAANGGAQFQASHTSDAEAQNAWEAGFAAAEAAVQEQEKARAEREAQVAKGDDADAEANAADSTTATAADSQTAEELKEALATRTAELAEAQNRYVRLQAEWDNFRKRTAAEADANKARAVQKLIEELIPVLDDFERALAHAKKTEPEGEFEAFTQGVDAIYDKVCAVFTKTKVEVIDPVNEAFDALEHQAVARVPQEDLPEETVVEVYQKGYKLGGYVIRPAMVSISTGGPQRA